MLSLPLTPLVAASQHTDSGIQIKTHTNMMAGVTKPTQKMPCQPTDPRSAAATTPVRADPQFIPTKSVVTRFILPLSGAKSLLIVTILGVKPPTPSVQSTRTMHMPTICWQYAVSSVMTENKARAMSIDFLRPTRSPIYPKTTAPKMSPMFWTDMIQPKSLFAMPQSAAIDDTARENAVLS